jgi:hypothetical protein
MRNYSLRARYKSESEFVIEGENFLKIREENEKKATELYNQIK